MPRKRPPRRAGWKASAPTPLPDLYLQALNIALDRHERPDARASAGLLMSEIADEMRTAGEPRVRPELTDLRALIVAALDHRIHGR